MGRKKSGPTPSQEQCDLIDALGGTVEVARLVTAHFNYEQPLTRQAVYYWRQRGIPFAYRACLAIHARERGIGLPYSFLNENPAGLRVTNVPIPTPRQDEPSDEIPWL